MSHRRTVLKAAASALLGLARPESSRASDPQDLLVAAYPAVDAIARAAAPSFEARFPGTRVHVVSRQIGDHHTAMMTSLSTAKYLPDVMAIELGYLGRFSRGGGLENLSLAPWSADAQAQGLAPFALMQARATGSALFALPSDIGPGVCIYRHDLLQRAQVDARSLVSSWPDLVEAGRRLRRAGGTRLLPHAQDAVDIMIRTGIREGDGVYVGRDGSSLLRQDRFIRAFEIAREVRRDQLDAQVLTWTSDWAEAIRRGDVACLYSGAWMVGHLQKWLVPEQAGLWRCGGLPAGATATYGGSFLAMPRYADPHRKRLAWEFIRHMVFEPQRQLDAFQNENAFPALVSTYQDAFFERPIDYLGGQRARLMWRDIALAARTVPSHRQDTFAVELLNTAMYKVLELGDPIERSLAQADNELARRLERKS